MRTPDIAVFSAERDKVLKSYIEHAFIKRMTLASSVIPEDMAGYKTVIDLKHSNGEVPIFQPFDHIIISFQMWKDGRKWAVIRKFKADKPAKIAIANSVENLNG